MNFFSNPNNNQESFNGSHSTQGLNTLNSRHPEHPDNIEDVQTREIDPELLKILRKSFIFLIVTGILVGVIVSAGIVYVLDRFDITAQPQQIEQLK